MPKAPLDPTYSKSQTHKIFYIDNLRIALTILVIVHHALITYGAPGSWYYSQKTSEVWALIPMTILVATNQSFFMGFFFFLSAFFIEASFNKKGVGLFISDRLKRLGIPLLFYSIILSPILIYLVIKYGDKENLSFVDYLLHYHKWINFGVLWFVAALLLFTLLYATLRIVIKNRRVKPQALPSALQGIVITIALAIISFIVRIVFPIGWTLDPPGFQLAHFPQYILMFYLGIIASRNNWLDQLNDKISKRLQIFALVMMLIVFPLIYYIKTITNSQIETFSGGWHWQSLVYALWEQLTGISIMYILLSVGKKKWNTSSPLLLNMSRTAYGVYIFHPLMLIGTSLLLQDWAVTPILKLLIVIPVAVSTTFLFATLLVRIPGVKKII